MKSFPITDIIDNLMRELFTEEEVKHFISEGLSNYPNELETYQYLNT